MKRRIATIVTITLSFAACKGGKDDPPKPDIAPPPTTALVVTATATASLSSSAPPAPSAIAPARISDKTIPLHVVADDTREVPAFQFWTNLPPDLPRPFHIHALRDRMLVTQEGPYVFALEDGKLKQAQELPLNQLLTSGYSEGSLYQASDVIITGIAGRWPDDVWIAVTGMYTDGARLSNIAEETYISRGDRWVRDKMPSAVSAWSRGRTLVLAHEQFSLFQTAKGDLPRRAAGKGCPVRIKAEAMAALPNGEVLVAGRDCDEKDRLAIERWAPDRVDSTVVSLPAPEAKIKRVWLLATERDRFVLAQFEGRNFLARIDDPGAASEIALPLAKPISDASLAEDGSLWILFAGDKSVELFRRDKEGAYARATLPTPDTLSPGGMYAASAEVVYLAGSTSAVHTVILSSRPGKLFDVPPPHPAPPAASAAAGAASAAVGGAPSDKPGPLSASCPSPFVVLFSVGKAAPADYDYPATRDALAGWPDRAKYRFVEYMFRGNRTLGASAPDAAGAEALAARIRERIRGSAPAPACFKPAEEIRVVKLGG